MTTICELRQQAAKTARGDPHIERTAYDTYLLQKADGTWQTEAAGLVVGSGLTLERAELLAQEHGLENRATWLIERDKAARLLRAPA